MDSQRFDDLTRALARARTRRGVLRAMLGGVAAGVAALSGREASAQRPARLANGQACTSSGQCASFRCVDGVCCDTACTGQCESCAGGTCQPIVGTPVGNRPACPGSGLCRATCDGVTRTRCAAFPGGDVACGASACGSGWQTTYACVGNGSCVPTTISCGLYVCGPTACLTGCASDADCVGQAFCAGGVCQGDRPLGEGCAGDDQCQSGVCAQGICCASACGGGCEACNLPGTFGFCTVIPDGGACDGGVCCDGDCVDLQSDLDHCGACDHACRLAPTPGNCEGTPICRAGTCAFTPLPRDTACRPAAGPCDAAEVCDGSSTACPEDAFLGGEIECRPANGLCDVAEFCTGSSAACPDDGFAGSAVVCRQGGCADGVATLEARCTGASAGCPDAVTEVCSPYLCGETACLDSCTGEDNEGCVPNHHCDAGQCLPDEGLGDPCNEDSDCISGVCNLTSTFCCAEACSEDVACSGPSFTCCEPDCTGKTCGDDGCGNSCGDCGTNQTCNGETCVGATPNGQPCSAGEECQSEICNATSDVCCSQICGEGVGCTGADDTCTPTTCGASGQVWCNGTTCNEGLDCTGGTCAPPCVPNCLDTDCGDDGCGNPCRTCESGRVCSVVGTCVLECGGDGDVCCAGEVCNAGLVCHQGAFCGASCGAVFAPCCPEDACNAGLACAGNNVCFPCGRVGELCCADGACNNGLECDAEGGCVESCGAPGDSCCAGFVCDDLPCSENRICEECGGLNQACCGGTVNLCEDGLGCHPFDHICMLPCGEEGEPCCVGSSRPCIFLDLTCAADNVCRPPQCGVRNAFCCEGEVCGGCCNCVNNICEFCGFIGGPCCGGGRCLGSLTCGPDDLCH